MLSDDLAESQERSIQFAKSILGDAKVKSALIEYCKENAKEIEQSRTRLVKAALEISKQKDAA